MKRHFNKISPLMILMVLVLALALPFYEAEAQISEPTGTFQINQVEAYRNALEPNDMLVLITGTIEYFSTPTAYDASEAFLVTMRDSGGTILGTTTFDPYHDSGYDYGAASMYWDANSTPTWSGNYTIYIQGNPSLHWLDTTATNPLAGALADDGGSFTDETTAINNSTANDTTLMSASPAQDDAYYFGASTMFNILTINIGTNGSWSGTYAWEYWDGTQWSQVSGLTDGTTGFTAGVGNHDITYTCPTDWQTAVVNGTNLYWLRFRVATFTSITTQPKGTQAWVNTLATPPSISTNVFSLWYDESTVAATSSRLTTRIRSLAQSIKTDWGGATDLVEDVAGTRKLTGEGEAYFEATISNLREMCPDLFADIMDTPDFPEKQYSVDYYMAGADADVDVYGNNWYVQTFNATDPYEMTGFWIKALRVGSPGTVTGSLRATTGGLASGADLATGTINGDDFSTATGGEWYEVTFTDTDTVTAGTVYAVALRATGGDADNYIGWRVDTGNGYARGQECSSTDGGSVWNAVAANDLMFSSSAFDAHSMFYRNRLADRLVGTRFDMTALADNLGMSRMWLSTVFYFAFCLLIAVSATRTSGSYRLTTYVFLLLLPFGALIGFIYLETAIIAAFLCIFLVIQQVIWSRSP